LGNTSKKGESHTKILGTFKAKAHYQLIIKKMNKKPVKAGKPPKQVGALVN